MRAAFIAAVLTLASISLGQMGGGGQNPDPEPQLRIEVRQTDSAAEGETMAPHVSMMRWRPAAWDWTGLFLFLTEDPGAIAGRFRCELKIDSVPAGWTFQSIQWNSTEDDLWDALLDAWLYEMPFLGPAVGALVHEEAGDGVVSNAWAYDGGAVYVANCTVTYLKPDQTQWVKQVSAASNELVLTAGGPLLCGIHVSEDHKPDWDDGYKAADEIPQPGLGYRTQQTPWYLEVFDLNTSSDSGAFKPLGEFGQPVQRGRAWLRLAQPEDGLTSVTWTVSGSADISAQWQGSTVQKVTPSALCPEIIIQAVANTDGGAITPKATYTGLYKQTPTSAGEPFVFLDHSDECPPPGYYTTTVGEEEEEEPADHMNYYRFTGHKPAECDPVGPDQTDPETLNVETIPPNHLTYKLWRAYTLKIKDASGRPMPGAWVQERFTALTAGEVWQVGSTFKVNVSNWYWITQRLDAEGDPTIAGYFAFDLIGAGGMINEVRHNGGIMFTGTHEYWVGSRWAPVVSVSGSQFTINDSGEPTNGNGLGIKTKSYTLTVRTNNVQHVKQ